MSGTHARGGDGFGGDRRRVPRNRQPARRRLKRRRGRSRTTQPKKFNHDIVCASSTEAVRKRGYFLITVVRERRGRIADRGGRGAGSIEPIGRKVHTGGWVLRTRRLARGSGRFRERANAGARATPAGRAGPGRADLFVQAKAVRLVRPVHDVLEVLPDELEELLEHLLDLGLLEGPHRRRRRHPGEDAAFGAWRRGRGEDARWRRNSRAEGNRGA